MKLIDILKNFFDSDCQGCPFDKITCDREGKIYYDCYNTVSILRKVNNENKGSK